MPGLLRLDGVWGMGGGGVGGHVKNIIQSYKNIFISFKSLDIACNYPRTVEQGLGQLL